MRHAQPIAAADSQYYPTLAIHLTVDKNEAIFEEFGTRVLPLICVVQAMPDPCSPEDTEAWGVGQAKAVAVSSATAARTRAARGDWATL